jgi:NTP pyrophosphatase (non-canonical NTP hydrolase)
MNIKSRPDGSFDKVEDCIEYAKSLGEEICIFKLNGRFNAIRSFAKADYLAHPTCRWELVGEVYVFSTYKAAAPTTPRENRIYELSFNDLRQANIRRLPQFKNSKGFPAHSEPDGSDWPLDAWANAVQGELGEAGNIIKKIRRGDFTLEEARKDLAREFADVVTYLDILAFRAGIDLGDATREKFNEISVRVGSDVFLGERS